MYQSKKLSAIKRLLIIDVRGILCAKTGLILKRVSNLPWSDPSQGIVGIEMGNALVILYVIEGFWGSQEV